MDEKNIKISLPDKINIVSPELESINSTAQRISNWLHNDLKKIIAPLQVLPRIPELISEFNKKVVEQFSALFKNQIETLIVARQANMKVGSKKIELVEQHLEKKKNQFSELKDRIINRYKNLSEKIVEQHSRYLNRLDNHVFDIVDKTYPEVIQEKFSFAAIPTNNFIAAHTEESALVRYKCLKDGFETAKKNMNAFLQEREGFYDKLESHLYSRDEMETGNYELPFWVVVVEDKDTKKRHKEIFFNWDLDENMLKNADDELLASIRNIAANLPRRFENAKSIDPKSINNILLENSKIPSIERERFMQDCKSIFIS
jgi:hypothetical protein